MNNDGDDKLDKNLMYHSELTGNWHKVYISAYK